MTGAESRAAESARAELDRVRGAAAEQVAQARQEAVRDQAELRAGLEAQIAAAEEVRAGLQARAEQAEARLAEAQEAKAAAEQEARAEQARAARRPGRAG